MKLFLLGFLLITLLNCSGFDTKKYLQIDLGPIISEVGQNSAIVWGRTQSEGDLDVLLFNNKKSLIRKVLASSLKKNDYTFFISLNDLKEGTLYYYKLSNDNKFYSFKTAPSSLKNVKFKIAWSGDLAGQNVCRDESEGYIIFKTIKEQNPNLFIGLGDMIYADDTCQKVGRYGNSQVVGDFDKSYNLENFWKHWRYNRADHNFRSLMENTPYLAIWDDHEVINDFGPELDIGKELPYDKSTHLMPLGYKSFIDYNPNSKKTLYKKISWGRTVDIFVLDTRQYRDRNSSVDNVERRKTMLGVEQLSWLKKELKKSQSQFKIIISSVPLSIPTGFPLRGDGWANFNTKRGYENELLDIIRFLHKNSINQTIWLTTDVHFSEVFHYTPFQDSPHFELYEVAVGPLSAGLFPNKEFDTSLGPRRLFYYGADSFYDVKTYKDAKKWSNFGLLDFDGKGNLNLKIINTFGEELYNLKIPSRSY